MKNKWLKLFLRNLPVAVIVCLDRNAKGWVSGNLELYERRELIPGFLGLFHTRNTGASFGLFSEFTWVLTVISAVAVILLAYVSVKEKFAHSLGKLGKLAVILLAGGAIGNLWDRLCYGYVVDMFEFLFISFAVFNVADVFLVAGGGLLVISQILHKEVKPAVSHDGDHHA
ncbi:MAG: signal peptidase II [Oscillospiraceae bacterium]|nr:signal peptidase II [Oscillospiraceae bacterium]